MTWTLKFTHLPGWSVYGNLDSHTTTPMLCFTSSIGWGYPLEPNITPSLMQPGAFPYRRPGPYKGVEKTI